MDIPDLDLPPPAKMSRRKKWWVAILLLAVFGGIAFLWFKDDALEDDSDLVLKLPEVSEDENGIRFFDAVVERFDSMGDDFWALQEMLSDYSDVEWDSSFVKIQIEQHKYMLDALDSASEADFICAADRKNWYDGDSRLSAIHYSGVIARALTRLAAIEGDISGAVDFLDKQLKIANTLVKTGHGNGEFGAALSLMSDALGQLETMLLDEQVEWKGGLKNLCRSMRQLDQEFHEAQRRDIIGMYGAMKSYIPVFPETKWGSGCAFYSFKPNRTLNIFAGKTRMALKQSGRPFAARLPIRHEINSEITAVLGGNMEGPYLLYGEVPNIDYRGHAILISRYDIVRTTAALRSFHADKGELPESLGDLVPQYLDKVPRDHFDGKPLRYSKSEAKVWCVGKDLIDEGGIETDETEFSRMPDPMMQLKWLAEEE